MLKKLKPLKFGVILIISVILTLGFSISLQSLLAAWTAPDSNPPTNNIADLNLGGGLSVATNALIMGNFATIGKIGISTTTPSSQLHLYKNSNTENAEIAIQSGNGTTIQSKWSIYQDGIGGGLRFWNNSVPGDKNALTVLNSGNVGIGNIAPAEKLDVSGNGKFSGVLSSGKMQIIDVVTEGNACTPNGVIARDANGLILSCQSGLWAKASGGASGTGLSGVLAPMKGMTTSCRSDFGFGPWLSYYAYVKVDSAGLLWIKIDQGECGSVAGGCSQTITQSTGWIHSRTVSASWYISRIAQTANVKLVLASLDVSFSGSLSTNGALTSCSSYWPI